MTGHITALRRSRSQQPNNADPNLFSVYAATNSAGNAMTLLVLNKDPNSAAQATFGLIGFTPSQVTPYTLSQWSVIPNPGSQQAWSSTMTFDPYTATLLVIGGSMAKLPANEWDLNPDTIMVPAGGNVTLHPAMVSGTGTVTLGSPTV